MKIKFFILFLIAACFATGCERKNKAPEAIKALLEDGSGRVLKIALYGDVDDLTPISYKESEYSPMVGYFLHAAPLRKDINGDYVPCLFQNCEYSVNEAGQLEVSGEWRSNIKWHDGITFNPSEFEYTLNQIADKKNESPYCDVAQSIVKIENGEGKCRIVFKSDSKRFLDLLTVGLMPSHILESPVSESATDTKKIEAYFEKPIGLGPYKITDRKPGSYIVMEPFKDFFDGYSGNRVGKVLFRARYNMEAMLTELRDGKYDWAGFSSLIYEQLKSMSIEGIEAVGYENNACLTWLFNTEAPELKDSKVRKALSLLVDRKSLINKYGSAAEALYSSPLSADCKKEPQNAKEQALNLLKEAGIDEQRKLHLNILVSDYNITSKLMAEKMVSDFAQYNVVLNIENVSWGEFVTKRLKAKNYMTAIASLYLPKDGNWLNILGTDGAAIESINFTGAGSKELDEVLKKLDSVVYKGDTNELKEKVSSYLSSEVPMAFLLKPYDISLKKGKAGITFKNNTLPEDALSWPVLYETKQ